MSARPVLRVGLTGGIASGKTTVAGFFAEHGAFVVDADAIGHDLIRPGEPAYAEVVARFGPGVLAGDRTVDRARLGPIVFKDPEALRDLNAIVHPRILPECERRIEEYLEEHGHALVAILDAALLVESGLYRSLDRLAVARCSRGTQIRRLMTRNHMSEEEASLRIASQAPLESKLAVADYVIDTDGTLRRTREEVDRVWRALLNDYEARFGPPVTS